MFHFLIKIFYFLSVFFVVVFVRFLRNNNKTKVVKSMLKLSKPELENSKRLYVELN